MVFFSCKKDSKTEPVTAGYSYAGIEVGRYVVYDVDSTYYDDFDMSMTTYYFQINNY